MSQYTIAIDNGVTGSIAILGPNCCMLTSTPTKGAVMGKAGNIIRRVDIEELKLWIGNAFPLVPNGVHAYIEKPFTGSAKFIKTTVLAARAFEATAIAMEQLEIGYEVVSSGDWQKAMLPGVKGRPALKSASRAKGIQLYPALKATIEEIGDADSLLMATHFHRQH